MPISLGDWHVRVGTFICRKREIVHPVISSSEVEDALLSQLHTGQIQTSHDQSNVSFVDNNLNAPTELPVGHQYRTSVSLKHGRHHINHRRKCIRMLKNDPGSAELSDLDSGAETYINISLFVYAVSVVGGIMRCCGKLVEACKSMTQKDEHLGFVALRQYKAIVTPALATFSNGFAASLLLLLGGDIETNPGPRTTHGTSPISTNELFFELDNNLNSAYATALVLELGFNAADLDSLLDNYPHGNPTALRDLLVRWVDRQNSGRDVRVILAEKLRNIGLNVEADGLLPANTRLKNSESESDPGFHVPSVSIVSRHQIEETMKSSIKQQRDEFLFLLLEQLAGIPSKEESLRVRTRLMKYVHTRITKCEEASVEDYRETSSISFQIEDIHQAWETMKREVLKPSTTIDEAFINYLSSIVLNVKDVDTLNNIGVNVISMSAPVEDEEIETQLMDISPIVPTCHPLKIEIRSSEALASYTYSLLQTHRYNELLAFELKDVSSRQSRQVIKYIQGMQRSTEDNYEALLQRAEHPVSDQKFLKSWGQRTVVQRVILIALYNITSSLPLDPGGREPHMSVIKYLMILKVYLSNSPDTATDVPITPETTCRDVVELCKEPGEDQCHLAELWRGCERPVEEEEKIYDILKQWGVHSNEVKFFLRHEGANISLDEQGRRQKKKSGLKDSSSSEDLKGGADLNLNELRDIASRQQQQIEMQQQMLVAKQQRLKFLKQQEAKHQQVAVENERLRRLRDKVDQQEMKLQKLRIMQGQADTAKVNNSNLSAELDTMRHLFKEKEQELASAVAKVDHLTQQLENIRRGNAGHALQSSQASHELDRLRRELLHRNQMNDQQSVQLENQRKVLSQRKGEVVLVDQRIEELTDLLKRKRVLQNQHRQSPSPSGQRSSPTVNSNNNAMTRNLPNGGIPQRRPGGPGDQGQDRSSPQLDNGGVFPQKPPIAPRPSRLMNGTNGQKPAVATKPVPAPKPSMLNQPGGFKPRTGSSVPVTGPQGAPVMPHQSQHDASGSETSSLTENSSLDSMSSFSHMRQSGNVSSNNRTGAGSPNQGNRWPQQNRSSPLQDGQVANGNKDLSVQVRGNLPMSQNDPRANYLIHRRAGDRSPMYSPSGQPASSAWDTTDLDNSLPPQPQGALRHPSSPQGKKLPPPPPTRSEKTKLSTPASSAAGASYTGSSQPFYSQANPPHGSESGSTIPTTQSSDQMDTTRPHHQRTPATVGMYAPPPNAHDRNYNRPSFEHGHSNAQYYPGRPVNLHTSDLFPIKDMQGAEEGDDAPISPNRPASPVKFPTLSLQRYMDPERIHNMPRPLKKRLSYTESKGENFSFLNAELRSKLPFYQPEHPHAQGKFDDPSQPQNAHHQKQPDQGGPGAINRAPIAVPEADDTKPADALPANDSRLEGPPNESEKKPDNKNQFQNDAILSHKQYSKALSQYSRSPILDQTKTKRETKLKGILKKPMSKSKGIRVRFDPLALLLDASLEGEFSLVRKIIPEVANPSGANDEGITALHNAICANHYEIVNFLINYGVDVNSPDSDGWTPLHCAASCNNIIMVRNLVEHGACPYASTISDHETPAQKCEEEEDGFQGCYDYLSGVQKNMGSDPKMVVFAVYMHQPEKGDELGFQDGDELFVVRKGDDTEKEWWWVKNRENKEGYVPRNFLGICPRVKPLYR